MVVFANISQESLLILWLPEARSPPSPLGLVHVREPFLLRLDDCAYAIQVFFENLVARYDFEFDLQGPKRDGSKLITGEFCQILSRAKNGLWRDTALADAF